MTAATAREALEAAIWRARGGDPRRPATDVDEILAAADTYAETVADERIAGRVHQRAIGRERLEQAAAETAERRPA